MWVSEVAFSPVPEKLGLWEGRGVLGALVWVRAMIWRVPEIGVKLQSRNSSK